MGLEFFVSSGSSTLFWHHNWAVSVLKYKFQNLFSFAIDKDISVLSFSLHLTNPLSLFLPLLQSSVAAVSQLALLIHLASPLLQNLQSDGVDLSTWKLPSSKGHFSTNSVYNFIKCYPSMAHN